MCQEETEICIIKKLLYKMGCRHRRIFYEVETQNNSKNDRKKINKSGS